MFQLAHGSHKPDQGSACAMEVVSMLAGESFTDQPHCACPAVTLLVIKINDSLDDQERQLLWPFVNRIVGTNDPPSLLPRVELLDQWLVSQLGWLEEVSRQKADRFEIEAPAGLPLNAAIRARLRQRQARYLIRTIKKQHKILPKYRQAKPTRVTNHAYHLVHLVLACADFRAELEATTLSDQLLPLLDRLLPNSDLELDYQVLSELKETYALA